MTCGEGAIRKCKRELAVSNLSELLKSAESIPVVEMEQS